MATTFSGIDEMKAKVGEHLGYSEWHEITQDQVNLFAEATGDHQWIHVDPERAAAGPFGTTIGHGYLTLSLLPVMSYEVVPPREGGMSINYGLNKVRFPAPLPVGGKVRMHAKIVSVEPIQGGAQLTLGFNFEHEGSEKPVCVAETLVRLYEG